MMDPVSTHRDSITHPSVYSSVEAIFIHPAGLQTAREIVKALISQIRIPPSPTSSFSTSDTMSSIIDAPETSPEVAGILREILALSDSEGQASGSTGPGVDAMEMGIEQTMQPGRLPSVGTHHLNAQTISRAAGPAPISVSVAPRSHLVKPLSPIDHTSEKSPEREIQMIFGSKGVRGSLSIGTESPYRVESPAARGSTNSSRSQPSQAVGEKHSVEYSGQTSIHHRRILPNPTSLPSIEKDSCRFSSYGSSEFAETLTKRFAHHEPKSISARDSFSHTSSISHRPNTLTSTSTRNLAHIPTTIKGFLPVNKSNSYNNSAKDQSNAVEDYSSRERNTNKSPSETPAYNNSLTSAQLQLHSRSDYLSTLRSPSPLSTTSQVDTATFERSTSENLTDNEAGPINRKMASQKRKATADGEPKPKKQKIRGAKATPRAKAKLQKPKNAAEDMADDIWMRIIEFAPPQFAKKVRLLNSRFKDLVDGYTSLFSNCRKENFGYDMPDRPEELSERQYSDLFGGKGCLEPGCKDTKASKTIWSWAKRWCQDCWKGLILRDDRILKKYQSDYSRTDLTSMLECIPVGVHDSFLKPHDYNAYPVVNQDNRTAPKLYKYHLVRDVEKIIADYKALNPGPFKEDPNATAEENAEAKTKHQELVDTLPERRVEFFATRKAANDQHMEKVQKIEAAVRNKRESNRVPHDAARASRKELFLRRAKEDLTSIPEEFVLGCKPFKAAIRVFRDGGTERGWQTLKPKIEKAWDESPRPEVTTTPTDATMDGVSDSASASAPKASDATSTISNTANLQSTGNAIHRPALQLESTQSVQQPNSYHSLTMPNTAPYVPHLMNSVTASGIGLGGLNRAPSYNSFNRSFLPGNIGGAASYNPNQPIRTPYGNVASVSNANQQICTPYGNMANTSNLRPQMPLYGNAMSGAISGPNNALGQYSSIFNPYANKGYVPLINQYHNTTSTSTLNLTSNHNYNPQPYSTDSNKHGQLIPVSSLVTPASDSDLQVNQGVQRNMHPQYQYSNSHR